MNIFITDSSPSQSAVWLDDKRINKMLLETCQMLSTAIRVHQGDVVGDHYGLYKKTHINHPVNIWARTDRNNYNWLAEHGKSLLAYYCLAYGKINHGCASKLSTLIGLCEFIPEGDGTPFVNCARSTILGIDFTNEEDIFLAYRKYLIERWKGDKLEPKWSNRSVPIWAYEAIQYRHRIKQS
jgi:hypothetical protein